MIIDNYSFFGLKIKDVYFAKKIENDKTVDIVRYFQLKNTDNIKIYDKLFITNIINLEESIEEIYSKFRKSVKSEINQSKKKDGTMVNFFDKPDVEIINHFCDEYDKFAKRKNISLSNKKKIKRLFKNILISNAVINNEVVVWHLYIYDQDRIRLLYSCTIDTNDKSMYNSISKANKLLHFEDIKFAKNKGHIIYDFGGLNLEDNEVAGIDQFKLAFSKEIEKSHHSIIGNTLLGKFIVFLYNLKTN
jgi:lipid II:glycine glycyltransferase (peptidoglycan interpeptide bridge formation enzyme)